MGGASHVLGAWCLVLGAWCGVLGAWCLVLGAWCLVLGAWCLVRGAGCGVLGAWCVLGACLGRAWGVLGAGGGGVLRMILNSPSTGKMPIPQARCLSHRQDVYPTFEAPIPPLNREGFVVEG